jgi:F0F1-type ATP synthase membrane subunit c/vacuolar-type H+-ATPase subunit K
LTHSCDKRDLSVGSRSVVGSAHGYVTSVNLASLCWIATDWWEVFHLGPLVMTGLSCFGSAVALGMIATGTWPADGAPVSRQVPSQRSLAIIFMAFSMSIAVIGTVVGLLAIFVAGAVTDATYGLLAAGPAVVGGLIGLVLIARHRRVGDSAISALAAMYVLGAAVLGCVVALMALVVVEEPTKSLTDWPFVILGLVSGASALAIGATGATAVRAMRGADEQTAKAIMSAQISRIGIFQIAYVAAGLIAILLIVVG